MQALYSIINNGLMQTRENALSASATSWLVSELMEWLLDAMGALMGKDGCRDMVACRYCP